MSLHDILRGDIMPLSGLLVSIGRNTFDPPAPVVPVNDIHHRSSILYDSGLPAQSGIITFNSARGRLELIPSNSGAQPIVTAVLFEAYDSLGTSAIGSVTTITFDTTRLNTHSNIYNSVNSELQINMSGIYEFSYRVGAIQRTGTFTNILIFLERQAPGGAFAEIPGSRTALLLRNNATVAHRGSANANLILSAIGVGDKFRVRGVADNIFLAGTEPLQLADTCSFTVRKLA
jgi:hypothetical protein